MVSRLRSARPRASPSTPPPSDVDDSRGEDRVTAWLNVFARLLHLAPAEREAIRDELESHLRERVRDLMLRGAEESDAVTQAVNELGETADLAARYDRNARIRMRRSLMQFSILGIVAAAGMITTITMITRPTTTINVPANVFAATEADENALPELLIDLTPEMTLRDLVERVLAERKVGIAINYGDFEDAAINPEQPLGIRTANMPLEQALRMIADISEEPSERLAWQYENDMLTLAPQEIFDRQSMQLVSYDLRAILHSIIRERYLGAGHSGKAMESATDDVVRLLQRMVDGNAWHDNGGRLAQQQVVGSRLFVEAPQRMHKRIQWIIGELTAAVIEPVQAEAPMATTSGAPGSGLVRQAPWSMARGGPAAPADR